MKHFFLSALVLGALLPQRVRAQYSSGSGSNSYHSAPTTPRPASTGYSTSYGSGAQSPTPPAASPMPAVAVSATAAKFSEMEQQAADAGATIVLAAEVAPAALTAGQRTRYYRQLLGAQVRLERYAEAAATYEQCLGSYPAAARDFVHEQATIAYYYLGQYAQGLTAANRRSAEAGPVAPYHKLLCQMGMGEYDAVLPVLLADEKEANYWDFPDCRYQIAVCQLRARAGSEGLRYRNVQLAEHNLQRYLESAAGRQAPRDGQLLLCEVYFRLRNYGACLRETTALLTLNPANVPALRQRADTYVATQKYPQALSDQSQVLRYDSQTPANWNARADTRLLSGDQAGALADANAALHLDSTSAAAATAYCHRGQAWLQQKTYEPAAAAYTRALAVDPACSEAYLRRGIIRRERKQLALACADFRLAVKYDTSEVPFGRGVSEANERVMDDCRETPAAAPRRLAPARRPAARPAARPRR